MKLIIVLAAWTLAATAGASLAHTNPGVVLKPFDLQDHRSSVQGLATSQLVVPVSGGVRPAN